MEELGSNDACDRDCNLLACLYDNDECDQIDNSDEPFTGEAFYKSIDYTNCFLTPGSMWINGNGVGYRTCLLWSGNQWRKSSRGSLHASTIWTVRIGYVQRMTPNLHLPIIISWSRVTTIRRWPKKPRISALTSQETVVMCQWWHEPEPSGQFED